MSAPTARTPVRGWTPPFASVAPIRARSRQSTVIGALAEVQIETFLRISLHDVECAQEVRDRPVAVAGHALRGVDRLVHRERPPGVAAVEVEHVGERALQGVGKQGRSRDRARVDHRVGRCAGIRCEVDRVERVAARLDPDPLVHLLLSQPLEREGVRQRLRNRLQREGRPAVADLVQRSSGRGERDAERVGIGARELGDVGGDFARVEIGVRLVQRLEQRRHRRPEGLSLVRDDGARCHVPCLPLRVDGHPTSFWTKEKAPAGSIDPPGHLCLCRPPAPAACRLRVHDRVHGAGRPWSRDHLQVVSAATLDAVSAALKAPADGFVSTFPATRFDALLVVSFGGPEGMDDVMPVPRERHPRPQRPTRAARGGRPPLRALRRRQPDQRPEPRAHRALRVELDATRDRAADLLRQPQLASRSSPTRCGRWPTTASSARSRSSPPPTPRTRAAASTARTSSTPSRRSGRGRRRC